MVGVAKARPGAAHARPLSIEAREPALVERGDPLGPGAAPADPRVKDEQGRECRRRAPRATTARVGRGRRPATRSRRSPARDRGGPARPSPRAARRPPRPSRCRDSRRSYSSRGVAAVNRRPYAFVTVSAADSAPITWP
jgi:hypothetical protein